VKDSKKGVYLEKRSRQEGKLESALGREKRGKKAKSRKESISKKQAARGCDY